MFRIGGVVALLVLAAVTAWWSVAGRSREVGDGAIPARGVAIGGAKAGFVEKGWLEDSGVGFAVRYTGPIRDQASLAELREAVKVRGTLGIAALSAELAGTRVEAGAPPGKVAYALRLRRTIGLLQMYDGLFDDAKETFAEAAALARTLNAPRDEVALLEALRGIVALRKGELDNCVACLGPSSCLFPIAPEAAHRQETGSREAIARFTDSLAERPGDLRVRWVLNIAHMTLDQYPGKVPPADLIPLDSFRSPADLGKFANVAVGSGVASRGPNMAGGSVFDDFTGDGLPDIFSTSLDAELGASLLVNKGDGTFADRSEKAGLKDQIYALNLARADYDNDGDLDVVLLRGGWESPMRLSLLRNKGDGTFDDVTIVSGMGEPISCESACWGDFDNDGFVDLFACGEIVPPTEKGDAPPADPRNKARLYRNNHDGTFTDVAAKAGVTNDRYAKGCAWGDYDGDGRIDLFVSNMVGASRLYHNDGAGKFTDEGPKLGVTGPENGFACWFWDYDNDGRPDLFVNDRGVSLAETAAVASGMPIDSGHRPHLYRNLGKDGFREVSHQVGLDLAMTPMGCNFGDLDNDGLLDVYFGTGGMSFSHLVPNLLMKNVGGRFEDATTSSGTGHLQKGHGVSFADYDGDGALDFFVEAGGAAPGDRAHNLLFRNPGNGRHWLDVRLVGTRTNRSALGAKLRAEIAGKDGAKRVFFRTIGDNSSFGGNTLVEHLGLGDSDRVAELTVTWPVGGTSQVFRDVTGGRSISITEGDPEIRPLRASGAAPAGDPRR